MKRTIPLVVSCLSLYVLGCILLSLELKSMVEVTILTHYASGDTPIYAVDNYDETVNICLDNTQIGPSSEELLGNVTGIDNFCKNNSTETIILNRNNVDLCFGIVAKSVGIDSICAVICDNFLICDTTYYIISVVPQSPSLTATPDLDSTSINSPITIDVLGNDHIPDGIITEMELIFPDGVPTNSTVTTNPDGTLNYSPKLDFCGNNDQFQYSTDT